MNRIVEAFTKPGLQRSFVDEVIMVVVFTVVIFVIALMQYVLDEHMERRKKK
jgi:hypothetical protein